MVPTTDNERRILAELTRESPLSKRDITARCGMGWATAVKLISRLEEQGFVTLAGSERQSGAGKTSTVYALSTLRPVAIGIDVEYARTRLSIHNLSGTCLYETQQPTPQLGSADQLARYLDGLIEEARGEAVKRDAAVAGVGVGLPSHLFGDLQSLQVDVTAQLSERHGLPVRIENNIRCFTAGVVGREPVGGSMLVVTVRSGIGVGIVLGGAIYSGEHGAAGEIGHFPVEPQDGVRCRCGKIGCLETVVNREHLLADFVAEASGDAAARSRLEYRAGLLGRAIATTMLVLDVRKALVFAELGAAGHSLVAPMQAAAAAVVMPGVELDIRYDTLNPDAYVAGATRLILNEYIA